MSQNVTLPRLLGRKGYHPMTLLRSVVNRSTPRLFVNWSANWSLVWMARTLSRPERTWDRKWWYFWLMCLVRGRIFGTFASSSAPALSSNMVQRTVGVVVYMGTPNFSASSNKSIKGRSTQAFSLKAIYSASVVERAVLGWSREAQVKGHPA